MGGSERLLVICPTARDRAHFARPEIRDRYRLELRGTDEATHEPGFDVNRFLADTLGAVEQGGGEFRGVVGIDDFPACMLAGLVAERFTFPFPSFESLFLCQHKYYSRRVQHEAAPESTPAFHVLGWNDSIIPNDLPLPFPMFVKPVKSYLSMLARPLNSFKELARVQTEAPARLGMVARMFDALVDCSSLAARFRSVRASALLLEELASGSQVTLDGYVHGGEVSVLGIVDSVFVPHTLSFARFEYPSRLPIPAQERMAEIAERVVRGIGLDRTFFNMEFFYHAASDAIRIVEINGRMASQFAPLHRMLQDVDPSVLQLEMALGRPPRQPRTWSPARKLDGVSASFVLRRFEDAVVTRVPSAEDLARVRDRFAGAWIEILVEEGKRLSDELQDDESYRYALINLFAEDWDELYEKFEAAKALLPFGFSPVDQQQTPRPRRAA